MKTRLLLITDLHFAQAGALSTIPSRRGDLIPGLLEQIRVRESGLDGVICMGDMIENGRHPCATEDWQTMKGLLDAFGIPYLGVPGNHDRRPAEYAKVFGAPEPVRMGHLLLLPFADAYDEKDVCTRDFDRMEALLGMIQPGDCAVAVQHNTILPYIDSDYPYTPRRYLDIAAAYAKAGVLLSLSGHYHTGIPALTEDGVTYYCGPALCVAPYRYTILTVEDRTITLEEKSLEA